MITIRFRDVVKETGMRTPRTSILVLAISICLVGWAAADAGEGPTPQITKHYIGLSGGQLHYVTAGKGEAVLLLHQAPLSHAEFLETMKAVGI